MCAPLTPPRVPALPWQEELKQKKREHARSGDDDPEHRRVCVTNTESGMTLAGEDAPLASELQASHMCPPAHSAWEGTQHVCH